MVLISRLAFSFLETQLTSKHGLCYWCMKSYLAYMHIWKQLPWDVALSHSQSLSCGGYRDYKYLTLHNQEGKQAD